MKRTPIIILAALSAAVWANGPQPAKPDPEEQKVVAAEKAWVDAAIRKDGAALSQAFDDALVISLDKGAPVDKAKFVDANLKFPIASWTNTHDVVRVYGDTAVIVGSAVLQPASNTEPTQNIRYTSVYVKRQGRWLLAVEQVASSR